MKSTSNPYNTNTTSLNSLLMSAPNSVIQVLPRPNANLTRISAAERISQKQKILAIIEDVFRILDEDDGEFDFE
jgi:hypothetical protein